MKTSISALLIASCSFVYAQIAPPGTVSALSGSWTWAAYGGGVLGLPLAPVSYHAHLSFYAVGNPDTLYCDVYHDTILTFSGPVTVTGDSLDTLSFAIQEDLMGYLAGDTFNSGYRLAVTVFSHDSMYTGHPDILDDFYNLLVRSCCHLSAKNGNDSLVNGGSVPPDQLGYYMDAVRKHAWFCAAGGYRGGLTIAVFDSTGCTNWISRYADAAGVFDPVSGYQYNPVYGNIHCKDRDLEAFDFPMFDPSSSPHSAVYQQRVVSFINSVPDSDFILVYSVNAAGYRGWSQDLVDVFINLGSQELIDTSFGSLRKSVNNPWVFFVQKGDPQSATEQRGTSPTDVLEFSATYNCIDVEIDTSHIDTTGISYDEPNTKIKIHPNPATEVIQLTCETPMQSVTIFNSMGQEIQEITPLSRQTTIHLDDLQKGIYLLRVEVKESVLIRKVIKN